MTDPNSLQPKSEGLHFALFALACAVALLGIALVPQLFR